MATQPQADLEASPDFWWLRLKYALREGDLDGAAEAQRRLSKLGVDLRLRSLSAFVDEGARRDD
jgi:hypothetical protein